MKKASIAKRYAEVMLGNLEDISIKEEWGMFDYCLAGEVLEQIKKPEQFLEKIRNVLKKTGRLLISVSDMVNWNETRLRNMLKKSGYDVENVWYYKVPGENLKFCQILMSVRKNR